MTESERKLAGRQSTSNSFWQCKHHLRLSEPTVLWSTPNDRALTKMSLRLLGYTYFTQTKLTKVEMLGDHSVIKAKSPQKDPKSSKGLCNELLES